MVISWPIHPVYFGQASYYCIVHVNVQYAQAEKTYTTYLYGYGALSYVVNHAVPSLELLESVNITSLLHAFTWW